jgi:DNA repair protein RadA/Sms
LQWFGACPSCGAAGTLTETITERGAVRRAAGSAPGAVSLHEVKTRELERLTTGIGELDRVLGGGLVAGQVVLIGGDPGIGKSTLLLQTLAAMGGSSKTLYVSGEESAEQVAMRARRLALEVRAVHLIAEIQLERIAATLDAERPEVAVVDSIQTLWSEALQSAPGSVAQVRECAAQLARHAKKSGTALFIIGHVTKEGAIAGPRVLEHIVDTGALLRGRPAFQLPPGARGQEPLRRGQRTGRVRHDRQGPARGPRIPRRCSCRSTRRTSQDPVCSRRWRARARCWWRSRRW